MPHSSSSTRTSLLLVCIALTACSTGTTEESSLARGDRAFAEANYDEALAEYRLALRQGADDPETLARVAHTYAMMDRVDDAGSFYQQAVEQDSSMVEQAVSDLMHLAEEARGRNDRFAMASAVETALKLRPGIGVSDMSLDLARHYFQAGEFGRALPFYTKALAEKGDSAAADVVFEVAQAYEQIGDCVHALVFFERYREMLRPWQRSEVDWYIGSCSFDLAREIRARPDPADTDLEDALTRLNRTLEVAEPKNLQAQAWFEKAETLSDLGRCSEAMDAYAQVRAAEGNSPALVNRAQDRYDEIRFGRGLESLRGGHCR